MSVEAFVRASLAEIQAARVTTLVRNKLVPKRSVAFEELPNGDAKYLHPTKGWKYISHRRFNAYTA